MSLSFACHDASAACYSRGVPVSSIGYATGAYPTGPDSLKIQG